MAREFGVSTETDALLRRLELVQAQIKTLERSDDAESRNARQKLLDELPGLEEKTGRARAEMESRQQNGLGDCVARCEKWHRLLSDV